MSDPTKFDSSAVPLYINRQLDTGNMKFTLARQGKPMVTIAADGTVTLGEGVSNDEASKAFWEAVEAMGNSNPRLGFRTALKNVLGAVKSLPSGSEIRRRMIDYQYGYNYDLFRKDIATLENFLEQ